MHKVKLDLVQVEFECPNKCGAFIKAEFNKNSNIDDFSNYAICSKCNVNLVRVK